MNSLEKIKLEIVKIINRALNKKLVGVKDLVYPPKPEFGDLSLPCFNIVKSYNKTSVEMAEFLVRKMKLNEVVVAVKAIGPFLNLTFNKAKLAEDVLASILKVKVGYGKNKNGRERKILVEFAHPNTHKIFHIGHLRNIITGEAVCRLLENSGYGVIRVNYQGDIGLHIAKCLWAIGRLKDEYRSAKKGGIKVKAEFLGQAYAYGAKYYEQDETAKKEINELNKKIYVGDEKVAKLYKETRGWSLKYFDGIYKRLKTEFKRFYFESEVFNRGREIALDGVKKGIFKVSQGAVIFPGEDYGLHNRVFITSDGNPTYEAKDLGLAELQFKEYAPVKIIHVVGPEQAEYFKVVFVALEKVMPKTRNKEEHLPYGWVRLKEGKMSSRLGNVIAGQWLLDEVKAEIDKIVGKNKSLKEKEKVAEKITLAAVKFSILKNGLNKDIAFDINESISLNGFSGPYLQYTVARINSIIRKAKPPSATLGAGKTANYKLLTEAKENELINKLAKYPEVVQAAGKNYDPSEVARFIFELAQLFNEYYHSIPVLKAEKNVRLARLALIGAISQVITNGLNLLGIEVVEKM